MLAVRATAASSECARRRAMRATACSRIIAGTTRAGGSSGTSVRASFLSPFLSPPLSLSLDRMSASIGFTDGPRSYTMFYRAEPSALRLTVISAPGKAQKGVGLKLSVLAYLYRFVWENETRELWNEESIQLRFPSTNIQQQGDNISRSKYRYMILYMYV